MFISDEVAKCATKLQSHELHLRSHDAAERGNFHIAIQIATQAKTSLERKLQLSTVLLPSFLLLLPSIDSMSLEGDL